LTGAGDTGVGPGEEAGAGDTGMGPVEEAGLVANFDGKLLPSSEARASFRYFSTNVPLSQAPGWNR